MKNEEMLEILVSIVSNTLGVPVTSTEPLAHQLDTINWSQRISQSVNEELGLIVTPEEIESSGSLSQLSLLLESRLQTDPEGRTIVDLYSCLKRLTKEEYHPEINFHWYARFEDFKNTGNWLTAPDSLDSVELVMRIEEEFGFSISDLDAQGLQSVAQTVRYLWRRSVAQAFTLRQRNKEICKSTFVFYELRRLLMVRAGIPRGDIRLSVQIGDLLPSWYAQFWKQIQDIFKIEQPERRLINFKTEVGKKTTFRELVRRVATYSAKIIL
jgi:hypothetical protein